MAIQRVGPWDRDIGEAGLDLSDKLFRAVSRATTGKIVLAAADEIPLGFIIETAKEGRGVSFAKRTANIVNGIAAEAIAIGDELAVTGTDGRVGKAAIAGTGFGFAREAAVADDVLEIEFK